VGGEKGTREKDRESRVVILKQRGKGESGEKQKEKAGLRGEVGAIKLENNLKGRGIDLRAKKLRDENGEECGAEAIGLYDPVQNARTRNRLKWAKGSQKKTIFHVVV